MPNESSTRDGGVGFVRLGIRLAGDVHFAMFLYTPYSIRGIRL